jgi:cell division protein FtsI/penicillin-binding protein 2
MRLKIISFIFLLGFVAVIMRLFYWQIIKGNDLSKQASYQYRGSEKVTAPRGSILASDGTWLAVARTNWLLFADRPRLENLNLVANSLSPILEEESMDIYKRINKEGVVWLPIKHKLTNEHKENIEKLGLKGLGFEPEESRFYPEGSSSANLLGFVGKNEDGEDVGYFGLEGYYDLSLKGKGGFKLQEKDLSGAPIISSGIKEISNVSGANLITYIEKTIQTKVEEKLKLGIEKYGAKEGSVVIMDPKTGGILAMASYPSYDPSKYGDYEESLYRNPVISDTFEPGSIFKIIVMAAALDADVVKPDTKCDICDGPLKVDKYFIETWNQKYYPESTMTDVIVHSDNVGMSFVAQKLDYDLMHTYLEKFGIGTLTGIDLQGEASAPLRKKGTWNIVDLVTSSFGQGIATTPIQILKASSVIANKGVMVTPKIVKAIELDGWKQDVKNKDEDKRIISKEASEEMTSIMVEAARHGEAQWTNLKGFSVAGKTGTAQIPIAGHYDLDATIASFIGFAPANNPKFIMLVTLKEPQSSQWASETAAPLWYSIARDLFIFFGIQPEN